MKIRDGLRPPSPRYQNIFRYGKYLKERQKRGKMGKKRKMKKSSEDCCEGKKWVKL